MGDRRQGDRREPEKGVVRVKFSDAVIYVLIVIILVAAFTIIALLSLQNRTLKEQLAEYESIGSSEESNDNDSDDDSDYVDDADSEVINEDNSTSENNVTQ